MVFNSRLFIQCNYKWIPYNTYKVYKNKLDNIIQYMDLIEFTENEHPYLYQNSCYLDKNSGLIYQENKKNVLGYWDGYEPCDIDSNIIESNYSNRKNCEHMWSELVFCIKILYPCVETKQDIINIKDTLVKNSKFIFKGNIDNYYIDISIRDEKKIKEYLLNIPIIIDIHKVYLTGKYYNDYEDIVSININKNTGEKYDVKVTKSDIYIQDNQNVFIGISLKSSSQDCITNYSISKIFDELEIPNSLNNLKLNVLKDGFGVNNYIYTNDNQTKKEKKEAREKANRLFYNKDNIYFKTIIELIQLNMVQFIKYYMNCLGPKMPYKIYQYNGIKYKTTPEYSDDIIKNVKITRRLKDENNVSAKLWYTVLIYGEEKYRFEIRFKNDIYNGSSQILTYNI